MSLAMPSQEKPRVKRKREGGDEKSDAEGRHAGDLVEDAQHDNLSGRVVQPVEGDGRPTLDLASRPRSSRRSPLFPWSQMSSRRMTDARRAKSMQEELLGKKTTKEKVHTVLHCLDDDRCMRLQEDLSLQRHHGQL